MPAVRLAPRALVFVALLLLSAAPVAAHDEHGMPTVHDDQNIEAPPNRGYTGPGTVPYISFVEGVWLYGQSSVTSIGDQRPRHIRGDGDWLVWEDLTRRTIYVHSISAGDGFHLPNPGTSQRRPAISEGVVVWEDDRHGGRASVYAYFLETGETRRLSSGSGSSRAPSIHGGIVTWEDDRRGNFDVYVYDLALAHEFAIAESTDRESDPVVLHDVVYYRIFRFNVWDIVGHDLVANRTFSVTSDVALNGAPFVNGDHVMFLTQEELAWTLYRYEPERDRAVRTALRMPDLAPTSVSGERLLQEARDIGYHQLIARNVTTGASNHISGSLRLLAPAFMDGDTIHLAVLGSSGSLLVALEASPFAFQQAPSLSFTSPVTGTLWMRQTPITGTLQSSAGWTQPVTFTYRVNDEPPRALAADPQWRFTLDPEGYGPGNHRVVVRATFREGPAVEQALTLVIPIAPARVDVEEAADLFHKARVQGAYNRYFGDNTMGWLLLPLVLALLVVWAVRAWVMYRREREELRIEYVPPE